MGSYAKASPCEHCDVPQTTIEPILLREATVLGIPARFNTEFLSMIQDSDGVTSTLRDLLSGKSYAIRSKFLVGGDGGRSAIVEQLKIPMLSAPGQGIAINV